MANIGATTAFYKVETSLTRANNEVSKSMERLATGKQNANAVIGLLMLRWQILFA